MSKKNTLTLFLTLFLFSCASIHPGDIGKVLNEEDDLSIKLSARNTGESSSSAFQVIEVTIENSSDKWLRIHSVDTIFAKNNKDRLSAVVGDDLKYWAEAQTIEKKRNQHNQGLAMMGLLAGGSTAMAVGRGSDNDTLAALGGAAVLGGQLWALSETINWMQESAQGMENKNPSNHLYNSFSVPGKMSLRRWILFNKPSDKSISKLVLKFETVEGKVANYAVKI